VALLHRLSCYDNGGRSAVALPLMRGSPRPLPGCFRSRAAPRFSLRGRYLHVSPDSYPAPPPQPRIAGFLSGAPTPNHVTPDSYPAPPPIHISPDSSPAHPPNHISPDSYPAPPPIHVSPDSYPAHPPHHVSPDKNPAPPPNAHNNPAPIFTLFSRPNSPRHRYNRSTTQNNSSNQVRSSSLAGSTQWSVDQWSVSS